MTEKKKKDPNKKLLKKLVDNKPEVIKGLQVICVDIINIKDNGHFKATFPADTSSDAIAATSASGMVAVWGQHLTLQSYQDQMLEEVKIVKKTEAKKTFEVKGGVNLGIFKVQIKKSWEW